MNVSEFVFVNTCRYDVPENEIGIVIDKLAKACTIQFIASDVTLNLPYDHVQSFNIRKTGDQHPKKICNICHRLLDTEEFSINQSGKGDRVVRRPSCKDCRKVIDGVPLSSADRREWNKIKPEFVPFKCPICHKVTIAGLTSKIVLDHDHSNGQVRGWICDSCNTGTGRFKDDVRLLERAIRYLKKD